MTNTPREEELMRLLGFVEPHAPKEEKPRTFYRCADCFCNIQETHTHKNEYFVNKILDLFAKERAATEQRVREEKMKAIEEFANKIKFSDDFTSHFDSSLQQYYTKFNKLIDEIVKEGKEK